MPLFSCFTSFGFLDFSGEPSECEKVYNSICAAYRDPKTGQATIDISVGTHQEAKIFAWSNAIAAARATLRGAGNELRPESSYCLLEFQERKFGMSPAATDSLAQRQAALLAKQKSARGPRYEAIWEGLLAIYGSDLVAYRPIDVSEAEAWPEEPAAVDAPGVFVRSDTVAKTIRILDSVARLDEARFTDSYDIANVDSDQALSEIGFGTRAAQSFLGDDMRLSYVRFALKKNGNPTGSMRAKLFLGNTNLGGHTPLDTSAEPGELAISEEVSVDELTGSYAWVKFRFTGDNRFFLEEGVRYCIAIEYDEGDAGVDEVLVGYDATAPGHSGRWSVFDGLSWLTSAAFDFSFELYTGYRMTLAYENWNRSLVEVQLVKGDVLSVDSGNFGVAERVTVVDSAGEGDERTFTADFLKPHTANTHATTGPTPIWTNSKRHVLVVVKSAAAVDVTMVEKTNELFTRVMRAPTTWAIVEPTTPGATTLGPFAIGDTLGSPLGAVPIEEIDL